MKKQITRKFFIIILAALMSPLFGLSCTEKKSSSDDSLLLLLLLVESQKGTIRVYNYSSYLIDIVNISPASSSSWGADIMSGYIDTYDYADFRVAPGYYDVRASASGYQTWETTSSIYVSTGEVEELSCN